MRLCWLLLFLIALPFTVPLWAQTGTITATVTGPDGCAYQNGTYNWNMTDSSGNDLTPGSIIYLGGGSIPTYIRNIQGTLDGFGKMSQAVMLNSAVSQPVGTKWNLNICSRDPNKYPGTQIHPMVCFSYKGYTVAGSADISSALGPITPPVCPGGGSGAGNPAPPSFAVQLANSGATAFQADANITINPVLHALSSPVLNGEQNEQLYGGGTLAIRVVAACTALGGVGGKVIIPATETSTDSAFTALPIGCVVEDQRGIILTGGNGFTLLTNGQTAGIVHNALWNSTSVNLFYPYIVDAVNGTAQSGGLNNYDGSTGVKSNFELRATSGVYTTPGQHGLNGMVGTNYSNGDHYLWGAQMYDTGISTASGDEGEELGSLYLFAGMPALTATVSSIVGSTLTLGSCANCNQLGEQQPIINTSRGVQNTGTATVNTAIPPVVTITGGSVTCPGGTNPCSNSTQNGVGLFFEFTAEAFSGHHIVIPISAVNLAGTQLTLLIQHRQTAPTTPTNTQWEGNTTTGAYAVYQGSTITAVPYTNRAFTTIQATVAGLSNFQSGDSIMVPGGNNRNTNGFNFLYSQNAPCPSNGSCVGYNVTSQGQYPIVYGVAVSGNLRQAAYEATWVGSSYLPNFGIQLQGPSPGVGYYQGADFATLTSTENMLCAGTHTNGANKCLSFFRTAGLMQDHFQLPDGTFAKGVDITDSMSMLGAFNSVGTIANNAGGFGTVGNALLCSYFAASCISNWITPSGGFALASVTANSATDLFGNNTVQKAVTDSSAGSAHAEGQQQAVTISLTATTNYVFSIYAMTDGIAPAAQINISFFGGGTWGPTCLPSQFSATYNLTTTLTRYTITCAVTSSTTTVDPAWVTFTPSANVYTWCAQLEIGTVPGPCLQTVASSIPAQIAQVLKGAVVVTGGTVTGTGTANSLPLWSNTSGLGNSHCDDGGTTAGIVTCTEPMTITGTTHGLTIPAGTAVAGATQKVILSSDASVGNFMVNENATGASRGCTAANGQCVSLTAALTTTAATSDNVTVTGMTSSGHCFLQATNASAATNIATTYVSAKTTNQITVTHTATASMTYDIGCTVN